MEIKSWEDYFLDLAKTCASRSNCIRAQVGAVIVGEDKKIKATGYNGTPSKVESCAERGECYRIKHKIESGTRYETCRSIHAEQNAIIQAGQDRCKDATMYIWGHNFICILCIFSYYPTFLSFFRSLISFFIFYIDAFILLIFL